MSVLRLRHGHGHGHGGTGSFTPHESPFSLLEIIKRSNVLARERDPFRVKQCQDADAERNKSKKNFFFFVGKFFAPSKKICGHALPINQLTDFNS